jgi:hypothetical protein
LCSLDLRQTRARVRSCAPRPAARHPGGSFWRRGRTVYNGASPARRRRRAVRGGGHPWGADGHGRQGGGWQSGAAGGVPPAKRRFADRLDDDEGANRTVNRPAEVAMGRKDSYTAGSDGNAARHTDARSLAIPRPRGTMIPTASPGGSLRPVAASSLGRPSLSGSLLRRTTRRVYASRRRPRIFFRRRMEEARRVPQAVSVAELPFGPRIHGDGRDADDQVQAGTWQNVFGRGGRVENSTVAGGVGRRRRTVPCRRPGAAGGSPCIPPAHGNLGMFGKPRKFLSFPAPRPVHPVLFR